MKTNNSFIAHAYFKYLLNGINEKNRDKTLSEAFMYGYVKERTDKISELVARIIEEHPSKEATAKLANEWKQFVTLFPNDHEPITGTLIQQAQEIENSLTILRSHMQTSPTSTENTSFEEEVIPQCLSNPYVQKFLFQGLPSSTREFSTEHQKIVAAAQELVTSILKGEYGSKIRSLLITHDPLLDDQATFLKLLICDICRKGSSLTLFDNLSSHTITQLTENLKTLSVERIASTLLNTSSNEQLPEEALLSQCVSANWMSPTQFIELKRIITVPFNPSDESLFVAAAHCTYLEKGEQFFNELINIIKKEQVRHMMYSIKDFFVTKKFPIIDETNETEVQLVSLFVKIMVENGDYERAFLFANEGSEYIQSVLLGSFFETIAKADWKVGVTYLQHTNEVGNIRKFAVALAPINWQKAIEIVNTMVYKERKLKKCFTGIISAIATHHPKDLPVALTFIGPSLQDQCIKKAAKVIAPRDAVTAFNLISLIKNANENARKDLYAKISGIIAEIDSTKAFEIVSTIDERYIQTCYAAIIEHINEQNPEKALELTDKLITNTKIQEQLYPIILSKIALSDIDKALKHVSTIDPQHRECTYYEILWKLPKYVDPVKAWDIAMTLVNSNAMKEPPYGRIISFLVKSDYQSAIDRMASVPEKFREECYREIILQTSDQHSAIQYTNQFISDARTKQYLYCEIIGEKSDPETIKTLVTMIDPLYRDSCYKTIITRLCYANNDTTQATLQLTREVQDLTIKQQLHDLIFTNIIRIYGQQATRVLTSIASGMINQSAYTEISRKLARESLQLVEQLVTDELTKQVRYTHIFSMMPCTVALELVTTVNELYKQACYKGIINGVQTYDAQKARALAEKFLQKV